MPTDVVVFMAAFFGQPFGLGQRADLLDLKQIVAQTVVKALDVGIFPPGTGRDER